MFQKALLLSWVAALLAAPVFSFQTSQLSGRDVLTRSKSPVVTRASSTDAEKNTEKGKTTLEFKGKIEASTAPLPVASEDQVETFFQKPENRALLATAGGKRAWEEVPLTDDLVETWKKACDIVGSQYPDENDIVLSVQTGGVDFPGLHLKSVAKIGIKLLRTESGLKYEYTFLGDKQTATGLPPVVWIFNKLTGAGGEKDGGQETASKSLSVVTYQLSDDSSSVTFSIDAFISIAVKFPSVLLKILPTNKEKAEETGGKAITKTVEKDIFEAMKAFEEAYTSDK